MEKIAVYPGTFDPVTYGHIDLIERGLRIFGRIIVAVAHSQEKKTLFSIDERVAMLKELTDKMKGVEVEDFDGLLVEYMRRKGAGVIIRGLRALSDFEYEFQMALTNRKLNERVETIFMVPSESYFYLSSHIIKETVAMGADVTDFLPELVVEKLRKKLRTKEGR